MLSVFATLKDFNVRIGLHLAGCGDNVVITPLRQADLCKFEESLVYPASSRPARIETVS